MSRQSLTQANRLATRALRSSNICLSSFRLTPVASRMILPRINVSRRSFASAPVRSRGIMPETENPAKEAEEVEVTYAVAELSEGQYHELADEYLENVLSKFEEIADAREDVDVEFSVRTSSNIS